MRHSMIGSDINFQNGLLFWIVLLLGAGVASQERVETTDGRELLLYFDGTYEEVTDSERTSSEEYGRIGYRDLRLDLQELDGKLVEVEVSLHMANDDMWIGDPSLDFDPNSIFAEDGGLDRDERSFALQNCGFGCRTIVRGEVAELYWGQGLLIHSLVR